MFYTKNQVKVIYLFILLHVNYSSLVSKTSIEDCDSLHVFSLLNCVEHSKLRDDRIFTRGNIMLTGCEIGGLTIGPRIGQGSFGEIYAVRNSRDRTLYAMKIEPVSNRRKILEFEIQVMKQLSSSPFFPLFISSGRTPRYTYLTMELLGPSLSTVAKRLPNNHFSLSSGLRVAYMVICALEVMHDSGFIHRDIKPSNILLRRDRMSPIVIIDFGLSRIYIDKATNSVLPPRQHPGFRGTTIYASPNAHMHQDLSRRDDLISWFYLVLDLIAGPLPWKGIETRTEVLHMKRSISMNKLSESISPRLSEIWTLISLLKFEDRPDYERIKQLLKLAMAENHVNRTDEWDWHPNIFHMDGNDQGDIRGRKFLASSLSSEGTYDTTREPLLQKDESCNCCLLL